MNKKQYRITLIVFGVVSVGLVLAKIFVQQLENFDWLWIFLIVTFAYMYIRYKVTNPLRSFATKFNMLVDYDLDVEGALKLTKELYDNAPTESVKQLVQIYLGMAYYYNAEYDNAVKTLNTINLRKVNQVYHILIFAFTAYAAFEVEDFETVDMTIERMENARTRINKRYLSFANGYIEILKAMRNVQVNPEDYRDIIERNFSREDGYISTKLVYNYRMALYFDAVNNEAEKEVCLAKVIANGKNHHTAVQAKKLFKGTVNVEDYVFPEPGTEPEPVEVVEEPVQIEPIDEVEPIVVKEPETIEEVEVVEEPTLDDSDPFDDVYTQQDSLSNKSVAELKEMCKERGIKGYSKFKKNELIEELKK